MAVVTVTVATTEGIVLGQVKLDADSVGSNEDQTLRSIGEQVVDQLPGGLKYLIEKGRR